MSNPKKITKVKDGILEYDPKVLGIGLITYLSEIHLKVNELVDYLNEEVSSKEVEQDVSIPSMRMTNYTKLRELLSKATRVEIQQEHPDNQVSVQWIKPSEISELLAENERYEKALEYVVDREDYTFAECHEAETIVETCRAALNAGKDK